MYPPSNKTWNTNILVVQTAAEPPNQGRMHLLTINCIWNSKNALRNEVDAKRNILARVGWGPKSEFAVWHEMPVLELKLLSDKNCHRCEIHSQGTAGASQYL